MRFEDGCCMSAWKDALSGAFRSPAPYLCWVALSVLFSLTGPFDTYSTHSLLQRVVYFGVLIGVSIAWGVAARGTIQAVFPRLGFWHASLIVAAVSAVILVLPIHAFTILMLGGYGAEMPTVPYLAALIFIIALVVASVRWAAMQGFGLRAAPHLADAGSAPQDGFCAARLLHRLSHAKRGEILRLSARDHYVEVVTDKGPSQVLLRLTDAIGEVDGVDGCRVHRSHWVAAAAVVGAEKAGDKRYLVLRDGTRVPVSRNYQAELAERGLITVASAPDAP
jgi:DNA-binding LytR/AlgR family response regulator